MLNPEKVQQLKDNYTRLREIHREMNEILNENLRLIKELNNP